MGKKLWVNQTKVNDAMKLPTKWECSGGKIETGESKEYCLRREIKEEINIDITIRRSLTMVEHQHSDFSLQPFRMQSTIWKSKSAGACPGDMGRCCPIKELRLGRS
ncbi:NUDIX domain-containing protein [Sphingobacterium puteale]|uniref:NUDIX domain-containing protein n=1 Tax=Sphingobacterium puteale TaxID=2420510 RepID=UPI003D97940A